MKKHALGLILGTLFCLIMLGCSASAAVPDGTVDDGMPSPASEGVLFTVTPELLLEPSPVTTQTSQGQDTPKTATSAGPTETEAPETEDSADQQGLFIEQRLQALGYVETGLVDGIIDSQTKLAIAHFEWLNGMPISGEVSDALLTLLRSSDVKNVYRPVPYPARALSQYLRGGTEVSFLSGRLVDLGYLDGSDPAFNPFSFNTLTEDAVRQFQKLNGFPTNGVIDLKNWGALFHPGVVYADGESILMPYDDWDWSTDFYPLLDDPIDAAYDGQYIWVLHSSGEDAFDNLLVRIDPKAGLLAQDPPVMAGDIESMTNRISQMLFDGNRLYLYMPRGEASPPQIVILVPGTAEKFIHTTIHDAQDGFPAEALGFDGSKIWATDGDSAWALNRNTGKAYLSYQVGWLTRGEMAFDGKCLWMAGEAGLAAFHTGGDYACPGASRAYALPAGPVVFDGQRIWTAGGSNAYWLHTKTGSISDGIQVGSSPSALAFDGKILWVANQGDDTVQGIDVATGSVGPSLPTGSQPVALVHDGQSLWVVNAGDRTLQRLDVKDYQIEIIQPTATPIPSPTATVAATFTPTVPPLERSLRLDSPFMRGDDVRLLQERLLTLGYEEIGWADGIFGPKTDEVIRLFQSINDLTVDGIVGPITWQLLFSGQAKGP